MADVKSTTIVPISFYCFVLAVYLLSLGLGVILSSKGGVNSNDINVWMAVVVFMALAAGVVNVGLGILKLKPVYWKILFFSLAICVSSIASFAIVFLVFSMIDINVLLPYYQDIQKASGGWFAFLAFFLSEIIILYYLISSDVVSCFGDMGPLISPF